MKFNTKDFLFNNGLVNLYQFILENDLNIDVNLNSNYLEIDLSDEEFYKLFALFLKEYKIVYQTNNDREYFDEKNKEFILDKKFDVVGGGRNDLRNGIYLYKKIDEFDLTREEVENRYLSFCKKYSLKPERDKDGILKVPNKNNEVIVHITLDEAVRRYAEYMIKGDRLKLDSKIHPFEDGQVTFHYFLKIPEGYKVSKFEAFIYWIGTKIKRFYYGKYYVFINSSNLIYLNKFKKDLKISEEKINNSSTNIDFFTQLSKDGITNNNFYISKSESEFELKLLMYIFSKFYNIEEMSKLSSKKRYKELLTLLPFITFVSFSDDGVFKTSLNEYTKTYKMFLFFEKLKEKDIFHKLADILITFSLIKKNEKLLESFVGKFLNFYPLRKELFIASFEILKEELKGFPKELFDFYNEYLNFNKKGEEMEIHKLSKKIGEEIGRFCAEVDDKDLLFRLRNVKNYKQLISFFKDLKYDILKNEEKAYFSKEFDENLEKLIENEKDWELIRDFVAIYSINKYRSVKFIKSKKGE